VIIFKNSKMILGTTCAEGVKEVDAPKAQPVCISKKKSGKFPKNGFFGIFGRILSWWNL
jgi:hypothetical protein